MVISFVMLFYLNSNAQQDCYLTDQYGQVIKKCKEDIKSGEVKRFENGTYLVSLKAINDVTSEQVASVLLVDAPAIKLKSNCLYLMNDTIDGKEMNINSDKWNQYNRQVLQIKAYVPIKIEYIKTD